MTPLHRININVIGLGRIGIEGSMTENIVIQGTPETVPSIWHDLSSCSRVNHFKVCCSSMQWQPQDQRLPERSRLVHEVQQDKDPYPLE